MELSHRMLVWYDTKTPPDRGGGNCAGFNARGVIIGDR